DVLVADALAAGRRQHEPSAEQEAKGDADAMGRNRERPDLDVHERVVRDGGEPGEHLLILVAGPEYRDFVLSDRQRRWAVTTARHRPRLTHALEVTQVATAVASALRLNVPLTEAIALGHDCGHGPGGHASEDALSPFLPEGYDHAVWGADVVVAPLNLCQETVDGIRNHSWSRPMPSTPEGAAVSWADRCASCARDPG